MLKGGEFLEMLKGGEFLEMLKGGELESLLLHIWVKQQLQVLFTTFQDSRR